MQVRLRPNSSCGCSLEHVFFLIALYHFLKARHVG